MSTSPRGPTPSRKPSSPVQVLSVPVNLPVCVRFLGPVLGLDTHWRSGRTIPCPGPDECPVSLHRTALIWKGYGPVEAWESSCRHWRSFVLEVTESLEEDLRGRDLRGEVWQLHRMQKSGKTDPVAGIFCERLPEHSLSKTFDIVPVLLRLFHVPRLTLGTRNPMPPKVVIEPVEGNPPNLPLELQQAEKPQDAGRKMEDARELWRRLREEQSRRPAAKETSLNGNQEGGQS